MCSSSACHPSPLNNELTTSEIKKLLYDSAKSSLAPKNFSISGGDPLQREDIFELMQYANTLGMKNLLYTTGQIIEDNPITQKSEIRRITKKEVQKLANLDIKVIYDLQSSDEKTSDKIMGTPGYFESVLHAIKLCKEEKIVLETHFVPQTSNFKHFFDYLELVKEIGVDRTSMLRFVKQGRGYDNPHLELNKKQFKELQYMFIATESMYGTEFMRLGHPINRKFLVDPKYTIPVCRGAQDAPLCSPTGEISMCPAWKGLKMYNTSTIREESLENIMNKNSYYKIFRDFIHNNGWKNVVGKCTECPYWSRCKSGCVAQRLIHNVGKIDIPLEKAILFGADPLCWWGDQI